MGVQATLLFSCRFRGAGYDKLSAADVESFNFGPELHSWYPCKLVDTQTFIVGRIDGDGGRTCTSFIKMLYLFLMMP